MISNVGIIVIPPRENATASLHGIGCQHLLFCQIGRFCEERNQIGSQCSQLIVRHLCLLYYCFGCHETGDVIDFTAKLFGLTPYEAAKKLAWDFHIDPNTPQPPVAAAMKKQEVQDRQDETFCMRALVDCEATLRNWKEQYAPSSPDDPWDDRFVEACNMLDYVSAMVDILFMPDAEMRKMLVQQMKEENTIQCLKERLEALREENEHGETEMGAA